MSFHEQRNTMDWDNIENTTDQWHQEHGTEEEALDLEHQQQSHQTVALLDERLKTMQQLQSRVKELEKQLQQKQAGVDSTAEASHPNKKRRRLPTTSTQKQRRCCEHCGQEIPLSKAGSDRDDEDEKMNTTTKAEAPPTKEHTTKVPIYARRKNPIKTGSGLIDGRSNADLAFEEKLKLFREYKEEFGSITSITHSPPAKYVPLVGVVVRLRKQYKAHITGKGPAIPASRMQALDELGFLWSRKITPEDRVEEFKRRMEQLRQFQKTYGHCCVAAVRNRGEDDGLEKFAIQQRTFLRISKSVSPEAAGTDTTATTDAGADTTATTAADETETDRKPTPKERVTPSYWTPEMRDEVIALEDPYINGADDEMKQVMNAARMKGSITRLRVSLNNNAWYQLLEEFRDFYKKNGHGFVPYRRNRRGGKEEKTSLGNFVWTEYKLYDAIKDGKLESHPILEHNQKLLKSIGFVYDKKTRLDHEKKVAAAELESQLEEEKKGTPHARLRVAQEEASAIKMQLAEAKKAQKLANDSLVKARNALSQATRKVNAAKKEVEDDPVGSIVHVKPRGPKKPGGLARVTHVTVTEILGEEVKFYNVEYVKDNGTQDKTAPEDGGHAAAKKTESHIEGCFIESDAAVSALLDLRKSVKVKAAPMVTRSRKKRAS